MSALSILPLRAGLRALVAADAALVAMLGGAALYDVAPSGVSPPYVTFGDAQWRDWSQAGGRGGEQTLALDVWSENGGLSEALRIAQRLADLLDGARPALEGHRLVDLALRTLETAREADGRLARARLTFRAVTETL